VAPGTGAPQALQNRASGGNGIPHFVQNWADIAWKPGIPRYGPVGRILKPGVYDR